MKSEEKSEHIGRPNETKTMPPQQSDMVYPEGLKLVLLMVCVFTTMFMVTLVRMLNILH